MSNTENKDDLDLDLDFNLNIKIEKYRSIIIQFINKNKNDLINIYMNHLSQDGYGVLIINIIDLETKQNVDVGYIPLDMLSLELCETVNERKLQNDNENIIYFLTITPVEEKIIEIDIRNLM